ncbi:ABC transporter ATP-binding protein [Cohnella fermenti]|uniref:ABC transporter ATP-binding protein n=1 Tax=Cohnella fermenti TaxID=2565925 RepID=A0A4S4BJU4_9BACL|nr:ABC transporter ATP-binding protein [Cohnella fermenti]THF74710.1 ABC transporter ATP-binding protein [Cohnella fermenti]
MAPLTGSLPLAEASEAREGREGHEGHEGREAEEGEVLLGSWSSPMSETGRMERRTIALLVSRLEIRDGDGACLKRIDRHQTAEATIRETGGGAWLELTRQDGGVVRLAMCPLAGLGSLAELRDMIERWVSASPNSWAEPPLALAEKRTFGERSSGLEGAGEKLTWRRRVKALYGLLSYAAPHRKAIALSVAALLVGVGLETLPPYLMKLMIDEGVMRASMSRFGGIVALLAAVYALQAGFRVWRSSISITIGNRMMSHIRKDMFDKLMKLPVRYYEQRATAPFIGRIQNDTAWVQGFLSEGISQLAAAVVFTAAVFAILFAIDWRLALGVLVLLPVCALVVFWLWPKIRSLSNRTWNTQYWLQKYIGEALQGIRVIKAFHREEEEKRRFERYNEESVRRAIDQQRLLQWLQPGINLAVSGGVAAVWLIGGRFVIEGTASLGTLVAFTTYLAMLLGQLQWNMNLAGQANASIAAADRIFDLLGGEDELPVEGVPTPLPKDGSDIAFEGVSFGYEKGREILHDIRLTVRPGEKLGITGPTGAGKSTLLQLLGRFYDPDAGSIRIGGVDLRSAEPAGLRRHVGIVFQESFLFDGTIADNIAYGVEDATPERIMEAARLARASAFIERLPYGYDTRVGERGVRLSGGEKQRISIARTLLLNPAVLLLDEATSSVDQETERDIQAAIDYLCEGRTTIAIAHRLSTIRGADRIAVLDKGRLVELGTHEELAARGGLYRQLLEAGGM